MDEVYTKIQAYLFKKDKECEKLRFLTSRTTLSNAAHVSDVCNTIKSILEDPTCPTTDKREKSIQHFKFLLLNTNFRSQEHLCEDTTNGHLVDICPPLSPYLFIEIIWVLNYDNIICDSILYIPIDLCSEILSAVRRGLDIDFHRAFNLVLKIIYNCYKKLVSMIYRDTQILDEEESLKRFMGSIQDLLSSLANLPSKKVEGLSQLLKYELCGWVLIRFLSTVRDCMALKRNGNLPESLNPELEKLHRITFGKHFMTKLEPEAVSESVDFFTKELIELLLENIKKIDCFVYMGWAELDYEQDTSMSMQRAVGLACYHFIEFLEADQQQLEDHSHMIECLRQLSSKPDAPFSMSLMELCSEVEKGNKECLQKLIGRYEEWNFSAISCFDENRCYIEREDCLSLLNSASKFLEMSTDREICSQVYATAMKIFLGQRLIDMVEIIVEFILTHNASRKLESTNFEADLTNYFNQGVGLCSRKTSLRIILFFIIQNPRRVLKTLIKAGMGYPEYENSISPQDFYILSPIMQIQDSDGYSLLLNALKVVCAENEPWNGKEFVKLIHILVDKGLISADNVLNQVFIPVLKNEILLPNIQSILICIRYMKDDFTPKVETRELLYALALQMAYLRQSTKISLNSKEEVFDLLVRIIKYFSNARFLESSIGPGADFFVEELEGRLKPLDKIYFAEQWGSTRNETSTYHVLQDYKKRCFYFMNKSKSVKIYYADLEDFLESHGLETINFLQHLILQCTESEYLRFGKEALIIHWNYFGWENELDAYAQFSLATIKTCCKHIESFDLITKREFLAQKIASLIKSLAKLTTWFISIDAMNDYESVYKSLVTAMSALNLDPKFSSDILRSYEEFKTISGHSGVSVVYSYEMVTELVQNVEKFAVQCLQQSNSQFASTDSKSLSTVRFESTLKFISICLNCSGEDSLLSKVNKKLYSNQKDGSQRNLS